MGPPWCTPFSSTSRYLTASTISFVQGDDHWDNEFKDKYMPDYGDIIPEVSEYAAGLPEEVSLF